MVDKLNEIMDDPKKKEEDKKVSAEKKDVEVTEKEAEPEEEIKTPSGSEKEKPADDLEKVKSQAEKFLGDIISGIKETSDELTRDYKTALQKPLTDVIETENSIIIKIDLPGVEKDDIDLEITDDSVTIKTVFEEKIAGAKYLQNERSHGKTMRTLKLPVDVDAEQAKASFNEAVLSIELPKLEKEVRKVDIN